VSVREISGIAFGRSRKGVLVALRVYFDGAGKEDDHPVITVGGFLAEATLCEQIEQEWLSATEGKPFHFTDFGTQYCKLGSAAWKSEDRSAFLKKLAGIVNTPGCTITSVSLEVAEFNKTLGNLEFPNEIGPAFSGCAYAAIAYLEGHLMNLDVQKQKVQYVFEKGDREHEIAKVFADWDKKNSYLSGLRGHSFQPKSTTLLEPSDLIAGVVQRCVKKSHGAFPSLDNGLARTRLNTFERHYSRNGVTAAVVRGHDDATCWVANAKNFTFLDGVSKDFFSKHPEQLSERRKRLRFKPKQKAGR
jgi:hypothetical protein